MQSSIKLEKFAQNIRITYKNVQTKLEFLAKECNMELIEMSDLIFQCKRKVYTFISSPSNAKKKKRWQKMNREMLALNRLNS